MVVRYEKGAKSAVSKRFNSDAFDCHCSNPECKYTFVDTLLCDCLDLLWELAGPFKINSGFRCEAHNAAIGGAKGSYHMKGLAADCQSLKGYNGSAMAVYADQILPFCNGGIGKYFTWVHVDVRKGRARWSQGVDC
jgi:zinc D-Ala-D-Ala carboxypeptidase